jgi:hypothetical protein
MKSEWEITVEGKSPEGQLIARTLCKNHADAEATHRGMVALYGDAYNVVMRRQLIALDEGSDA